MFARDRLSGLLLPSDYRRRQGGFIRPPPSLFGGSAAPLYQNQILGRSGLLGYWRMNAASGVTESDLSGNGNPGTYTNTSGTLNGVTLGRPAIIVGNTTSKSVLFTPTVPGLVNFGNPSLFQITTGALEFWCGSATGGGGSSFGFFFGKQDAWAVISELGGGYGFYDWGGGHGFQGGSSVVSNSYIVLNFNSGVTNGTKLYIDNVLVVTGTMTVGDQTYAMSAGCTTEAAGAGQGIQGPFSEIALWSRNLTTAEMNADYTLGKTGV